MKIFVETFAPTYNDEVQKFVTTIAEPMSRSSYIQKYKLTSYSLYAAMALEKKKDVILEQLAKFNKFKTLHEDVKNFIIQTTEPESHDGQSLGCGLLKTILINGKYYLEAQNEEALSIVRKMLNFTIKIELQKVKQDKNKSINVEARKQNQLKDELKKYNQKKKNFLNECKKREKNNYQLFLSQRKDLELQYKSYEKKLQDNKRKLDNSKKKVLDLEVEYENWGRLKDWEVNNDQKDIIDNDMMYQSHQQRQNINPEEKTPDVNRVLEFEKMFDNPEENPEDRKEKKIARVQIKDVKSWQMIKQILIQKQKLVIDEYDHKINTLECPKLDINLSHSIKLRPYQEKAIGTMFASQRARSGIIVLPCGAGKTLVGIKCITKIQKRTIIFCPNGMAVDQWYREILDKSDASIKKLRANEKKEKDIKIFCFKTKSVGEYTKNFNGIVITTLKMFTQEQSRLENNNKKEKAKKIDFKANLLGEKDGARNKRIRQLMREQEWGLAIYDEAQQLPAETFQRAAKHLNCHTKLGLSATLVREDNKIANLNFLIGPKLYEENWQDLTNKGYLAKVQCIEIRCPMTIEFQKLHDQKTNQKHKEDVYVSNPNKYYVLKMLLKQHEGKKILIFADKLFVLKKFAEKLQLPYICGEVAQNVRTNVLEHFRGDKSPQIDVLFFSKVGDNAIDLPDAQVLIQISSHGKARRQETQRLGRILRPKKYSRKGHYSAYFYSVISEGTTEAKNAPKRQSYLINQGYTYELLPFKKLKNKPERELVFEQNLKLGLEEAENQNQDEFESD